jgi:hypothetical protein
MRFSKPQLAFALAAAAALALAVGDPNGAGPPAAHAHPTARS